MSNVSRVMRLFALVWCVLAINACTGESVTANGDSGPLAADWKLESCELSFKGKKLTLGIPIEEWESVLGKHDRFVNLIYVFDHHGIKLYERDKKIQSIVWVFKNHRDYSEEEIQRKDEDLQESYRRSNAARPKPEFSGTIDVGGGEVKAIMDMNAFNQQRLKRNPEAEKFGEGYLPTLYVLYHPCEKGLFPNIGMTIVTETESKKVVREFALGRGD